MFEPPFPHFDKQDGFDPEEELSDLLGPGSMAPPTFNVTAGDKLQTPDQAQDQGDRDQFITATAQREMETTADFARFLPFEDLQEINQISHPVKDAYLDPLTNANLSRPNLELLYQEWQEQDPDADPRKFAYMLSTAISETYHTLQGVNEAIGPEQWSQDSVSAYADSGYWGRGFAKLTWQSGYQKLGEELGLDLEKYPRMALLPTIAADIMGTGMFQSGFGSNATLDQFLNGGQSDWKGARSIVGVSDGEAIGARGEAIFQDILAFHKAQSKGEIPKGLSLTDFLYENDGSKLFEEAKKADAVRLLNALGYCEFEGPELEEPSEQQAQYLADSAAAGYAPAMLSLNKPAQTAALAAFQRDYNAAHPLENPLNEQGLLDEATQKALHAGGHQIQSGNAMIGYAFDGALKPTDLFIAALSNFKNGSWGIPMLASKLLSYMPAPDPGQVQDIFEQLSPRDARRLALSMGQQSETGDALAGLNREVLELLRKVLQEDSADEKQGSIAAESAQGQDIDAYAVQLERIEALLARGA